MSELDGGTWAIYLEACHSISIIEVRQGEPVIHAAAVTALGVSPWRALHNLGQWQASGQWMAKSWGHACRVTPARS